MTNEGGNEEEEISKEKVVDWLILFRGISTTVGYLMQKSKNFVHSFFAIYVILL